MKSKSRPTLRPAGRPRRSATIPARTISNALPNELWLEIISYFSKKELKVVRLLGDRHLENLASSRLFQTAYIAARKGVFSIFKQMTAHPTIRHFIKEVIYDGSWFDPPDGAHQMRDGGYRITSACSDLPLAKLFQEQEQIQTRELTQALKTAFAALTHVRRVVFADLSRTAGLPGDVLDSEGRPLVNRVESGRRTVETGHCCLRGPNAPECGSHRGVFRRQYNGVLILLRILSASAPSTLDELSLGDGRYSSDNINYQNIPQCLGSSYGGIPSWYFVLTSVSYLDRSHYPIFQRLRKLDLTICCPSQPKDFNAHLCPAPSFPCLTNLGVLLNLADNLEDLRLCGFIDTGVLVFSDTLGSKTWTKLRNLKLRYFSATFKELMDFIRRHRRSLQHVELDFFNLSSGGWHQLDNFVSVEMPELSIVTGWVWQDGKEFEPEDSEDDPIWLPRKKKDRLWSDADLPDPVDDDQESSSEEELDFDSGSEVDRENS